MHSSTRETLLGMMADIQPQQCVTNDHSLATEIENLGAQCELQTLNFENYEAVAFAELLTQHLATELVVLTDVAAIMTRDRAIEIIGSIRNQLNAKVIFVSSEQGNLRFNDMIGLGFKLAEKLENGDQVYTYDIANYNKKREWNNSRFWANPENFDKFRW